MAESFVDIVITLLELVLLVYRGTTIFTLTPNSKGVECTIEKEYVATVSWLAEALQPMRQHLTSVIIRIFDSHSHWRIDDGPHGMHSGSATNDALYIVGTNAPITEQLQS